MKKELRFNAIFIVSILFLSIFVSAISTGEGGSNTSDEDNNSNLTSNTTREETNRTVNKTRTQIRKLPELRDYNCEDFDERSDRIKCRLINKELAERYNKNNNIIPEACKLIDKIVEIKVLVLNNGTKREVRVKIEELKNMWRNIVKDE